MCVYRPWPKTIRFLALVSKLYLATLATTMAPDLYLLVQVQILVLTQLLALLLSLSLPPPLLLLLLQLVLMIKITRNAFAAAKLALNDPEKIFGEKLNFSFSKFVSVMTNVFLIREVAVILKEIGGWLFLK